MTPKQIKARLQPFRDAVKRAESHYQKERERLKTDLTAMYVDKEVRLLKGEFKEFVGRITAASFNPDDDMIILVKLSTFNSWWFLEQVEFLET